MIRLLAVPKRLLLGRARPSSSADATLLPKRLALPVFASDPVSSVAYATQELLVVLALGGAALLTLAPSVAAAVCVVVAVVVVSYGQVVRAYPRGGGSYHAVSRNLGPRTGLVAAAALIVDYTLTVAVSVSAAVGTLVALAPGAAPARVPLALGAVGLVMLVNLRGRRESGLFAALPVYGFVAVVAVLVATGLIQAALGSPPVAASAEYELAEPASLSAIAAAFLVLRAFAGGGAALAGVEAIANGVPAFRRPKPRNAAITLLVVGGLTISLIAGVVALASLARVQVAQDPCDLVGLPGDCEEANPPGVLAQLAEAVFGAGTVGPVIVAVVTVGVLLAAANSAFNGFPLLAATLAEDRSLPHQLAHRGDRLAYGNGIVVLAVAAGAVVVILGADLRRILDLYLVGLFTSFTLAQLGMVVHFRSGLMTRPRRTRPAARAGAALAAVAAGCTGTVLVILLVTKGPGGAWVTALAIAAVAYGLAGIRRHYGTVAADTALTADETREPMPARVHAVVLASRVNKPTLRALAYARATRPSTLEAVTVAVEPEAAAALAREWAAQRIPVPLRVLDSPYRELAAPLVEHVRALRAAGPRDAVTVFVPDYVVGHWWEAVLHNQSTLWLRARLQATPGVMMVGVPWHLPSARDEGDFAGRVADQGSLAQLATQAGRADDSRLSVGEPGADR